ncbi:AraC family transcriptional regulator ligand-binding domain-containing protein [Marinobacter sp. M216]|uniref:AraC family transcriptional regulator ligand-binding domain-containing protein n=1 Tax=Marinobacter albus TaxID=3030833 RepID=A0ABT7H9E4_9GAMM|nr:AraC family transcriptional regulator [Marinobacter sp. M216]MDK9556968.1 AraC family transcriptional regulator ligand-binding domain-containing protein [Marinobacter sp. M216]
MHETGPQAPTAARYIHSLCQLLATADVPIEDLLSGTDVQPQLLDAPDHYVSHYSLDRVLHNVEQRTGELYPGVRLGHHLNISAHGSAGYAGLTAPNARQAIDIAVRFFPLITQLVTLNLDNTGKHARLVITPTPGISERTERFVIHTLLASFDVMGRFLVGQLGLRASLAFPRQEELSARLGPSLRDIAFDQPQHSLSLPPDRLEIPFALADRTAHAQAVAECEEELKQLKHRGSLAEQVLALLTAPARLPRDQESVAAQLGMSSRTLHRRLQREGVSYRALLLDARITDAKHCLLRERLSVTETAYRLGYDDSANFTRAFRQATGMTPTGFVKMASASDQATSSRTSDRN